MGRDGGRRVTRGSIVCPQVERRARRGRSGAGVESRRGRSRDHLNVGLAAAAAAKQGLLRMSIAGLREEGAGIFEQAGEEGALVVCTGHEVGIPGLTKGRGMLPSSVGKVMILGLKRRNGVVVGELAVIGPLAVACPLGGTFSVGHLLVSDTTRHDTTLYSLCLLGTQLSMQTPIPMAGAVEDSADALLCLAGLESPHCCYDANLYSTPTSTPLH